MNIQRIVWWTIKPPTTPVYGPAPKLKRIHNLKRAVGLKENCSKEDKENFNHINVVSMFIFYELDIRLRDFKCKVCANWLFFGGCEVN